MNQSELAKEAKVKMLEQLPNGHYVARYGFLKRASGTITFVCSQYVEKPTLQQISNSVMRYVNSLNDDEKYDILLGYTLSDYNNIE